MMSTEINLPSDGIVLVDGDIIVYRVGYTTDNDEWGIVRSRVDNMLLNIMSGTKAALMYGYLTEGANNFRNFLGTNRLLYKGNRSATKPKHYGAIRTYLIEHHGFEMKTDHEADDALGYTHMELTRGLIKEPVIIASIDKDLLQIPGWHYNIVSGDVTLQPIDKAAKTLAIQILIGDRTDNIPPIYKGLGPVKAEAIIKEWQRDYASLGTLLYKFALNASAEEAAYSNSCLVYIHRSFSDNFITALPKSQSGFFTTYNNYC